MSQSELVFRLGWMEKENKASTLHFFPPVLYVQLALVGCQTRPTKFC